MGEILRAMFDKDCVDSRPAFYTLTFTNVTTNAAKGYGGERRATLQCKPDTYFLCMGYTRQNHVFNAGGTAVGPDFFEPCSFQLFDTTSNKNYMNIPVQAAALAGGLNNAVSLSEYILFEPRQLITAVTQVLLTAPVPPVTYQAFIVLSGIEYNMAGGGSYYGR